MPWNDEDVDLASLELVLEARQDYKSGELDAADSKLLALVETDFPPAAYEIGFSYLGAYDGRDRCLVSAEKWFLKSYRRLLYKPAALQLGKCYYSQGWSKSSFREARQYFELVEDDFSEAAFALGVIELAGRDTPKNPTAAKKLFEKAQKMGSPNAGIWLQRARIECGEFMGFVCFPIAAVRGFFNGYRSSHRFTD